MEKAWSYGLAGLALCVCTGSALADWALPFGASRTDTSLYALGHYVHNVVFLQDDVLRDLTDPERRALPLDASDAPDAGFAHFTEQDLLAQRAAIQEAADFWVDLSAERLHPEAQLSITLNFVNDGQPFTVDDWGTIDDDHGYSAALGQLDPAYANRSGNPAARDFNRDTREAFGADWAWTTFVRPAAPRTASAFINGPYVTAFLDSDTYIHAHEAAHIFGAQDHYAPFDDARTSGYLGAPNTGAEVLPDGSPNPGHVPSMMSDFGLFNVLESTFDQIGWRDSDADTIPDILDTTPIAFAGRDFSSPFGGLAYDSLSGGFGGSFTAVVDPLERERYGQTISGVTLNTIAEAAYRIDGGGWVTLPPVDGTSGDLGDASETYQLALLASELPMGQSAMDLELRITNSVGNASYFRQTFAIPEPTGLIFIACLGLWRGREPRNARA